MGIHFTRHADEKFEVLRQHNFKIERVEVIKAVLAPETLDFSRRPLLIAQRKIDKTHFLRVVYRKEENVIKIITFYPARIKQYVKRAKQTKN